MILVYVILYIIDLKAITEKSKNQFKILYLCLAFFMIKYLILGSVLDRQIQSKFIYNFKYVHM